MAMLIEHYAIVKKLPKAQPRVAVYRCIGCGKWRPWCDGGTDSQLCDACWAGHGHHGCSDCAPFLAELNRRLHQ